MSIKASVAAAVLAVSTIGVSACASAPSKDSAAAAPTSVAGPASSTSSSAAPSTPTTAPTTPTSAATSSTSPKTSPNAPVRTDIPTSAMLAQSDLLPAPSGSWQQHDGSTVPGVQVMDPDGCDPTPRPQFLDPKYPHNPAWVNGRTLGWSSSNSMAQVNETVITYTSVAAAGADFTKHKGWTADCASRFQWTDAPTKFTISTASLPGVSNGYAIRVAMDSTDHTGSTTGSMGVDYMAVIQRGNSVTVLNVSNTGAAEQNPKDPGLTNLQHTVQAAVAKLGAVYTSAR
ncbi:hypothetical protein Caci_8684 [Catenulispora acidiphila DSM 44928]|uniref:PknH-like extracellular domain-containing protein n=1 Tax=Catenulispora acidiphila (strain DSM 44928 / JCM 14897 / NBRC 102108 / NRRL B-24433 / ID139908) TaxID=479433 RepID=C7Q0G6_CATAD|nr:hypothetical protein [Catenulispora acidiphila]ACU77499.1 hypothetical protein Caci_8684 [Catenulispora acidiphila DSM 44928]